MDVAFHFVQQDADSLERKIRAKGLWGHADWTASKIRRMFPWSKRAPLAVRLVLNRMADL